MSTVIKISHINRYFCSFILSLLGWSTTTYYNSISIEQIQQEQMPTSDMLSTGARTTPHKSVSDFNCGESSYIALSLAILLLSVMRR